MHLSELPTYRKPLSIFLLWLFVVSALIGITLGYADWFIPKTPINQTLGAVLLFLNFPISTRRKLAVWLLAFAVGMAVEIIGVKTGVLFGEYHYGDNFGWKLMGVPYLIGVYWAVLVFLTGAIAFRVSKHPVLRILIGAALMVGLDVLIEPLAHQFDFWHFTGGMPPLQNYTTWFLVAAGLHTVFVRVVAVSDFWYSLHHFLSQVGFFVGCLLLV